MQTRSQTAAAAIASNAITFMDNINESVDRKTRLIRRTSLLPKQEKTKLPQYPFTIQTRSKTRASLDQTNRPEYDVVIDFDAASKAWNKNKRRIGNGCYVYK